MNLVEATGDVEREPTVVSDVAPGMEADRQAVVEQLGRTRVNPVFGQAEDRGDIVHGSYQGRRERLSGDVPALVDQGDDVQILGDAANQPEEQQTAATDHGDFVAETALLEQRAERLQGVFEPR